MASLLLVERERQRTDLIVDIRLGFPFHELVATCTGASLSFLALAVPRTRILGDQDTF